MRTLRPRCPPSISGPVAANELRAALTGWGWPARLQRILKVPVYFFHARLDRNFYRDQPISIRRLSAILFVLLFLECSLVVNGKSHIVVSTLLIEGTVNNVPAIILLDTGSREDIKVVREFLRHTSACITQDFCRLIRPRSWKPSRCSGILSWYLRTKTARRLTSQQKGSRQSGSLSHF